MPTKMPIWKTIIAVNTKSTWPLCYTKYIKCTTIFLTISNLCEEDIRSYFDNIQDDSESDIQDHFSDYELSESENEDMTVENANNMDAIVYSETYWFCLFWDILVLFILRHTGFVYSQTYLFCLFWDILVLFILRHTGFVYSQTYWFCLFSDILVLFIELTKPVCLRINKTSMSENKQNQYVW
jgi:hypothetical protein